MDSEEQETWDHPKQVVDAVRRFVERATRIGLRVAEPPYCQLCMVPREIKDRSGLCCDGSNLYAKNRDGKDDGALCKMTVLAWGCQMEMEEHCETRR